MSIRGKTVWYCHHYAGSPSIGMSFRPYFISKYLNEQNYSCHIIGSSYHHLLQKKLNTRKKIEQKIIDGISYVLIKTNRYSGNGILRIINILSYSLAFISHYKQIIAITGKPDVIIVSSAHPFHFFPLYWLRNRLKIKIIFEVRDLWPLSLNQILNVSSYHPVSIILSIIEKNAYQKSDKVVSLLPNALPYMTFKGMSPNKYVYIPNGTELDSTFPKEQVNSDVFKKIVSLREKNKFIIGYAGSYGEPNALEFLIRAMSILKQVDTGIHCIMVGNGGLFDKLIELTKSLSLRNVSIYSSIPKNQVSSFLGYMDALYLGWNDVDLYKYGTSPNKLFDYLKSGKPIIESGGQIPSLVAQRSCGIQCEAANPIGIANAILRLSQTSEDTRIFYTKNSLELVKEFDYRNLSNKYMQIMEELL